MSKMKFQDWLKENTIAIDGSTVNTPTGTSKTDHEIMAGEWNQVGIAAPVGTAQQLAGVAKPTGEVAEHPGIVTSVQSIKGELEKPGLKEAIAALSPTLAEALTQLHEIDFSTSSNAYAPGHGNLKMPVSTHTSPIKRALTQTHTATVPNGGSLNRGDRVKFTHDPINNTTSIHHAITTTSKSGESTTTHHYATLPGGPEKHLD